MKFRCLKVSDHKFELDAPPDKAGTSWMWKGSVHCPYCGTEDLEEVIIPVSFKRDMAKARDENREATMAAQRMAGQARQEQNLKDPEMTLTPIQGAGRFGTSAPVKVRKSLMDSIAAKVPDAALLSPKE